MNEPVVLSLIADTETLPAMPEVALKVLDTMTDDMISLDAVAQIIGEDPAISARVIGLANSAYFGTGNAISTVTDAIITSLGLDLTRGIAIGMACSNAFDLDLCPSFRLDFFWSSALATSAIAEKIARKSGLAGIDPDICAVMGLLDSIGLLGFAAIAGDRTDQVLRDPSDHSLAARLQHEFGCNQYDLAEALASSWDLPANIREHFHARSHGSTHEHPNSMTVALAHQLASEEDYDRVCDEQILEELQCLQLPTDLEFLKLSRIWESSRAASAVYA